MTALKVFCAMPTASEYLCAVEIIIRDIQRSTGDDLVDIAENIDASKETISNAVNKKNALNPTYLARLGAFYGSDYLNPYLAMFNAQAAPIRPMPNADCLPAFARIVLKIAEARDPSGPGGATEVPQERRGYLPDLKEAIRQGGCLASQIEVGA